MLAQVAAIVVSRHPGVPTGGTIQPVIIQPKVHGAGEKLTYDYIVGKTGNIGGDIVVKKLDDTLQLIRDFQYCSSLDGVRLRLLKIAGKYGLHAVMAGSVPDSSATDDVEGNVLFFEWPVEWFDRYLRMNYVASDPVVLQAMANREPFLWSDAARIFGRGRTAGRVIGDASEFRLRDGLAFPLTTLEGVIVLVSLGGEKFESSPAEKGVLSLVVTYALGRALQLATTGEGRVKAHRLSDRETECLRWAALGKSEWEISCILGISEHTAERHLLNAKHRLGAANRVQAVAEAIRLGIIT